MRTFILCAMVAVGCKGKESAEQSKPEGAVKVVAPAPATASAPTSGALDLPAIDLKPIAPKKTKSARGLNLEGMKLLNAKDAAGAAAKFEAAVRSDPGLTVARYNLACAYNLSGDAARALAILKQFKDAGCPACLGDLVHARDDHDLQSLWSNADFKAVTDGVTVDTGEVAKLAADLERAWRAEKVKTIASMFDPRHEVKILSSGVGCDATPEQGCTNTTSVTGSAAITAELAKHTSTTAKLDGISCSAGCCNYNYSNDEPDKFMMSDVIVRACFTSAAGGVNTLSSIEFLNGGI
jgi:hypothetical protein